MVTWKPIIYAHVPVRCATSWRIHAFSTACCSTEVYKMVTFSWFPTRCRCTLTYVVCWHSIFSRDYRFIINMLLGHFLCSPLTWGKIPNLTFFFSNGLKPPTSNYQSKLHFLKHWTLTTIKANIVLIGSMCLLKVFFYGVYHGKSPKNTTVWQMCFDVFQPPGINLRPLSN